MKLGFVSTRFSGIDGVSLEAAKWATVLERGGHEAYWFAGELDKPEEKSVLVAEALFSHPKNIRINREVFGRTQCSSQTRDSIAALKKDLKKQLSLFVKKFGIDVLIPQNSLCLPMPLTLGLAVSEFIQETKTPTVAHHHDFFWERDRYAVHPLGTLLEDNFPPRLDWIEHVTINSAAGRDLEARKAIRSQLVPNIWDFENPPAPMDEYARSFRKEVGLDPKDTILLQPTRVVARKGIEHAVTLVSRLKNHRCKVIIGHSAGDEGMEYKEQLLRMAKAARVDLRFVGERIGTEREIDASGQRQYTLADLYQNADFVTYPSLYEGFGNALLETIYFKKPLLVNRYSVFKEDIAPKGFRFVTMDGVVTDKVVKEVEFLLQDAKSIEEITEHNYKMAIKYYSFSVLQALLEACFERVSTKPKSK